MNKQIVIIDDDKSILKVLQTMLEEEHYEVKTVQDPTETFDTLKKTGVPDLILLDVNMDKMNGINLCKKLKADKKTNQIPILLMSAGIHMDEKKDECNADGYLHKPFGMDEFFETVRKWTH